MKAGYCKRLKPTRLESVFEEKEKDEQETDSTSNLKGKIITISNIAGELLNRIYAEFSEFTDHSKTHKQRVLKKLDLIIPESLLNEMDVYELFFLIASTYLHDIGMADIQGLKEYAVPKNVNRFDFIRKNHHLRAKEFIINKHKEFPLKLSYRTNHTINIAFLSLLLRLADELDLTYERTPEVLLDLLVISSAKARFEWKRQNSTIGVSKDPEDNATLLCSADCDDPEIYRALRKIEDKINNELGYYPDLIGFHGHAHIMKEIPRKFRTKIYAEGFYPYDFKFSVDRTAIFNLLGKQLYHYEDEPIREGLKNAIDACRYRREMTDTDYEPKIKIQYDDKNKQLVIEDNGIGMDQYQIENYLTVIGKSFYRSSDFTGKSHSFHPLSELGIGILSFFLLADKVEIETRTKNSEALRIIIDNNLDYFLVFKSARTDIGTKVILHLKDIPKRDPYSDEQKFRLPYRHDLLDKSGKTDYLKIIQYYAVHVEFPITYQSESKRVIVEERDLLSEAIVQVQNFGKNVTKISEESSKEGRRYFREAFREIKKSYGLKNLPDMCLVCKRIEADDAKGHVGIILAKDKDDRLIPWMSLPYIYSRGLPSPSLSLNGIFIPTLIFDDRFDYGGAFWYDVDLKIHLKLDASRNEIINRWGLAVGIISDLCNLIKETILSIGTIDDDQKYNINNDLLFMLLHRKGFTFDIPSVKKLFRKYIRYRCISKNKIEYLDAKQVKENRNVVLVYLPKFLEDDVMKRLVRESPKFKKTKKYIFSFHSEFSNDYISHLDPVGIRNFVSDEDYKKLFKKLEIGPSTARIFKEYNI